MGDHRQPPAVLRAGRCSPSSVLLDWEPASGARAGDAARRWRCCWSTWASSAPEEVDELMAMMERLGCPSSPGPGWSARCSSTPRRTAVPTGLAAALSLVDDPDPAASLMALAVGGGARGEPGRDRRGPRLRREALGAVDATPRRPGRSPPCTPSWRCSTSTPGAPRGGAARRGRRAAARAAARRRRRDQHAHQHRPDRAARRRPRRGRADPRRIRAGAARPRTSPAGWSLHEVRAELAAGPWATADVALAPGATTSRRCARSGSPGWSSGGDEPWAWWRWAPR